jgi:hypothetical protein
MKIAHNSQILCFFFYHLSVLSNSKKVIYDNLIQSAIALADQVKRLSLEHLNVVRNCNKHARIL